MTSVGHFLPTPRPRQLQKPEPYKEQANLRGHKAFCLSASPRPFNYYKLRQVLHFQADDETFSFAPSQFVRQETPRHQLCC